METTSYFEAQQEAKQLQSRIASFFDTFTIGTLLNTSGIRKLKGTTPLVILALLENLWVKTVGFNEIRG